MLLLLDQSKVSLMAQHSHVPKFGNWDGKNIGYTAYFETARRGRGVGGRINLNPNDAEERDELIRDGQHHGPLGSNGRSSHHVRPPSSTAETSNGNVHAAQQLHQEKKHHSKEGDAFAGHTRSPYHDHAHRRDTTNAHRSRKNKATLPGLGGEESGNHQLGQPQTKAGGLHIGQRHDFLSSTSPQKSMSRAKNNRPAEAHHKVASVPKFGAWDVTSPESGAGFTMIFDKVKEERQNAANKLPTVLNTPRTYSPDHGISGSKPIKSKIHCCCLPMVG